MYIGQGSVVKNHNAVKDFRLTFVEKCAVKYLRRSHCVNAIQSKDQILYQTYRKIVINAIRVKYYNLHCLVGLLTENNL